MDVKSKQRRRHSAQFKAEVVAACSEPGASVAAVARRFDLNDNLVHQWRRGRGAKAIELHGDSQFEGCKADFVPLSLPAPASPNSPASTAPTEAIRIELKRGSISVTVHWPQSAAAECVAWLQELLR